MFHVRRRPADSQPRRRKKKPLGASNGTNSISSDREGPVLVEVTHSGDGGRRIKLANDPVEVGSANTNCLQLFGPSIQPRHCLISLLDGVCTVTPLHTDALTFVNGHHITQPTILHNGSVVMFGRVASYRFVDSPTDGRYNLALSQSQLDSACLYESRSPTSPGSWNDEDGALSSTHKSEYDSHGLNNNNSSRGGGGGGNSVHSLNLRDTEENVSKLRGSDPRNHDALDGQSIEGNLETETKSISSMKSCGSISQERSPKMISTEHQGQEPILPAVLEFPETHQELFLRQIITDLDVNAPHFKLAPAYSLYLCARYRASTHYRPELQPTERAQKLTIFLHHVANLMYNAVQEQYTDPRILAFWMANSSEFLNFLKSDRHISAFSVQAQEVLAESVQIAFRNLVNCFRIELSQTLNQFLSENIDNDSAACLVLTVLGSAMALLRRCRVNAALTIQLFSQLFHYINVICFNTIVANTHMCTAEWGKVITDRLQLLELWAERQGLELAADCHLAKINQCAQFLQAPKTSVEEIQQLACSCFRLNSLQMAALLQQEKLPRNLVDTAIRMAESVADELTRADGREVLLEESPELHLALLLPDDGFSCDVVRGIPSGLVDFLNTLQQQSMCRLAAQPTSIGLWTVYMHQFNTRSSSAMSNKLPQPEVQVIKLHKNSNGMGLSIVAAKGAGQERLGIYIKSVVPGGAADADGRLQAGDQLLRVDGQSLIGITQERAADYLVRTGPVVTLEVAKQGAIYHGLATLLQQPSPVIQRDNRRMSERDLTRMGTNSKNSLGGPLIPNPHLSISKSVPTLHHHGSGTISNTKSRSTHSLINNPSTNSSNSGVGLNNNEQGFYQNLSVYRAQNQSQPILAERSPIPLHSGMSMYNENSSHNAPNQALSSTNGTGEMQPTQMQQFQNQQQQLQQNTPSMHHATASTITPPMNTSSISTNRPASAYYYSTNSIVQQQQQQQSQQTYPIHQQNTNPAAINPNAHASLTLGNRSKSTHNFNRGMQNQHGLRMQQMLAPSMPNISNMYQKQQQQQLQQPQQQLQQIHNLASNITASQSMQNVNSGGIDLLHSQHHQNAANSNNFVESNSITGYMQQQHSPAGQSLRRNPRHELIQHQNGAVLDNISHQTSNYMLQQNHQTQQQNFNSLPPKPNSMQQQQQTSPVKQQKQQQYLPPTAPKPQPNKQQYLQQQYNIYQQQQHQQQQQQNHLDDKPPLPPTLTHPLYKTVQQHQQITAGMNYVASSLDPPKGGYVPVTSNQNIQNQKNFIGTNPWEREEREKEVEMRREHARLWREQQISELSNIQHRAQQQEEQLKTLILEREFERRAQELEEQDDESEPSYEKNNIQEVFRLTNQSNAIQTPVANFRQTEIKIASVMDNVDQQQKYQHHWQHNDVKADSLISPSGNSSVELLESEATTNTPPPPPLPSNPPPVTTTSTTIAAPTTCGTTSNASVVQPKSILKNNRYDGSNTAPSSPSKSQKSASFADENHLQTEHPIAHLTKDISNISLATTSSISDVNSENGPAVPPPPPPERNSSYLIMSQQKQRNSSIGLLKTAIASNSTDALNQNSIKNANILLSNTNNNLNNNNSPNSSRSSTAATTLSAITTLHDLSSGTGASASALMRDNKRVSFHDEDNNYTVDLNQQSQFSNDLYEVERQLAADLDIIREDANFLQRNTDISLLPSMPTTPDTAMWNTSVQSTPGVIGAQEVYRDPRQRRLAEKQQQQQQRNTDAVPEKLSFKEKMKMFALESGEDNTPKDKLKISRAQRDIDAVH